MNTLINKVVSLPVIWRYGILLVLCLFSIHLIYQKFLKSQNAAIQHNENKLSQLNNQINQYYRDQKKMLGQQQVFNELDQQLSSLEKTLASFNQEAPERAVLDSAVKSNIKAEEIKISRREQDDFGYYYLINIKVNGDQQNVSEFFSQLLGRGELAVWEQIEFQQSDDQLSLSLLQDIILRFLMKCMSKVQLTFYMALIFSMYFQPEISHAQDNNAARNVIELKSLKINHQVDLSKIFKPSPTPVGNKQKSDIARTSEQPIDLQLVGTMILGEKKFAWLKVENQVYQLESGQSIPGLDRQISQINPESIVLIHAQPCKVVDSCNSSLTLTIRDALF